ncbi:hypothetical protein [Clostridium sp. UBA1056]|uniref:hypothetical protein n=1 Tax=unclassified Clostridium TaxID=2614128 RepID=UPI0032172D67
MNSRDNIEIEKYNIKKEMKNTFVEKSIVEEPTKLRKSYEVINYVEELPLQTIAWSTSFSYTFEKKEVEGYKLLREERIVGCYYRQEHIEEILNTFGKCINLRFKLVAERDYENEYDSNALKISLIYLVDDEVRKMHIGFLSKETASELKEYNDIKVSLVKIENINYKDTNLCMYLKSELVEEFKEKKKRLEAERKLKEINSKIAFEMNQLGVTLEKMGRVEEAIEKYKESIELGFDGSYPFDRLNIFYRKEKDYDSEISNCEKAISLFDNLVIIGRIDA